MVGASKHLVQICANKYICKYQIFVIYKLTKHVWLNENNTSPSWCQPGKQLWNNIYSLYIETTYLPFCGLMLKIRLISLFTEVRQVQDLMGFHKSNPPSTFEWMIIGIQLNNGSNPDDIMFYWLVHRDPENGIFCIQSIYNRVAQSPIYSNQKNMFLVTDPLVICKKVGLKNTSRS